MAFSKLEKPFQEGKEPKYFATPDLYKVLLVDDNEDFLELFKVYAKKKNLQLLTASSGREGLSLLENEKVDCVVLDYMMPDLNGGEIFQALKDDVVLSKNRDVPAIVISAVAIPSHKLKGLYRSGIKLFLPKSFGLRELIVVVENICFAAKVNRENDYRDRYRSPAELAAMRERRLTCKDYNHFLRLRKRWRENPLA